MGKLVYFEEAETDWQGIPDSWEGKVPDGEPAVRYKILTDPQQGVPGIQFVEFEAGHQEKPQQEREGGRL